MAAGPADPGARNTPDKSRRRRRHTLWLVRKIQYDIGFGDPLLGIANGRRRNHEDQNARVSILTNTPSPEKRTSFRANARQQPGQPM